MLKFECLLWLGKLNEKFYFSSLVSPVSSKFLFRCALRLRPSMSSASLKVRAISASDLLLFNALPSSFSKPEDFIRISLQSEFLGYRLFEFFDAESSSNALKVGISGMPVDARCSSYAHLAKYFVFFIEWLHSKHLVINLFRFSRGVRSPSFRKIDWFHIAPRPHIADAAPVCSRILSKSPYSKTSPFAITGQDTASTTCLIMSQCAGCRGL